MNMLHLWSSPNFLAQLLQDIYEYLDVSNVDGYMPEYSLNSSWFIQNVVGLKRKKKTKCSLQRAVNWLLDLSQLPGQRENKKGLEITGIFFLIIVLSMWIGDSEKRSLLYKLWAAIRALAVLQRWSKGFTWYMHAYIRFRLFFEAFFLIRPIKTIQVIISTSIVLCYFTYGSNLYSIFLQSFLVDLLAYIVCIL